MDGRAGAVGERLFDLIRCGTALRMDGLITTTATKFHEVLRTPPWPARLKTYWSLTRQQVQHQRLKLFDVCRLRHG
jgi:hypothetical protein